MDDLAERAPCVPELPPDRMHRGAQRERPEAKPSRRRHCREPLMGLCDPLTRLVADDETRYLVSATQGIAREQVKPPRGSIPERERRRGQDEDRAKAHAASIVIIRGCAPAHPRFAPVRPAPPGSDGRRTRS